MDAKNKKGANKDWGCSPDERLSIASWRPLYIILNLFQSGLVLLTQEVHLVWRESDSSTFSPFTPIERVFINIYLPCFTGNAAIHGKNMFPRANLFAFMAWQGQNKIICPKTHLRWSRKIMHKTARWVFGSPLTYFRGGGNIILALL